MLSSFLILSPSFLLKLKLESFLFGIFFFFRFVHPATIGCMFKIQNSQLLCYSFNCTPKMLSKIPTDELHSDPCLLFVSQVRGKVGIFEAHISGIRAQVLNSELQRSPRSPRRSPSQTPAALGAQRNTALECPMTHPQEHKVPPVVQNGRGEEETTEGERRAGGRDTRDDDVTKSNTESETLIGQNDRHSDTTLQTSCSNDPAQIMNSNEAADRCGGEMDGGDVKDGKGWTERDDKADRLCPEVLLHSEANQLEAKPETAAPPQAQSSESPPCLPDISEHTSNHALSIPQSIPAVIVTDHGLESQRQAFEGSDQGPCYTPSPGSSPTPGPNSSMRFRKLSSSSASSAGFSSSWEESEEDVSSDTEKGELLLNPAVLTSRQRAVSEACERVCS